VCVPGLRHSTQKKQMMELGSLSWGWGRGQDRGWRRKKEEILEEEGDYAQGNEKKSKRGMCYLVEKRKSSGGKGRNNRTLVMEKKAEKDALLYY